MVRRSTVTAAPAASVAPAAPAGSNAHLSRVVARCAPAMFTLALTGLLAGCDGKGAAQTPAGSSDSGAAVAGGTATRDSLAEWRAKFGNRVPRPDSVRALYVNAWAAGSRSRMAELIRMADETEVNAFIVDIKESDTFLAYDSTAIPLVKEIGGDTRPATKWMPELLDTLQAHGIYSIARIVVFKDRMLAEKKPELAIRNTSGGVWRDGKGQPWVNPYDSRVWDYNIAIAREALDMGYSELQWDYVRFPDVSERMRSTMSYPKAEGKSRADNIKAFLDYTKKELASYQVPLAADVFGLVTHLEDDVGIGQNWEKVITSADVVLPMVYPSHYYAGLYGMSRPHASPYQTIRLALTDAVERTTYLRDSAKVKVGEVMPWLEAMSIRGLTYGPTEVRLQIQATYDAGLKSWALWNPGSKYAEYRDALRPQAGGKSPVESRGFTVPQYTLPRGQLSKVIQTRERAARVADSVAKAGPSAAPAPADSGARR
ncbi:MAG: putative glycoside hydrolase [Gemmatimonadota bacterium]